MCLKIIDTINNAIETEKQCLDHCQYKTPYDSYTKCSDAGEQCVRLVCLAYVVDCESGNKKAILSIISDRNSGNLDGIYVFAALPDLVHLGKNLKGFFCQLSYVL